MIKRISGLFSSFIVALLLTGALGACSKSDGSRILGHWRADRLQVQSISVPMGPEFVINRQELISLDGDIRIPISSISEEGDTVTLGGPLGLGLSFYFENADRMYFELPLLGRVTYQRIPEGAQPARANPPPAPSLPAPDRPVALAPPAPLAPLAALPAPAPAPAPAIVAPPAREVAAPVPSASPVDLIRHAERKLAANELPEAEALLVQARQQRGDEPMIDYNLAILRMRAGDEDAAVRHLRDAFQHGFRGFSLLDASADLAPLKTDPRYNALLTRYR